MISVCIITKNEREFLIKNLKILKNYPCEIVVVDTGSTDDSFDIANNYADICGHFEWCDDFAKAKNFAISLATNDIILVLDTDEMIVKFDVDFIIKKLKSNPVGLGKIKCVSPYIVDGEKLEGTDYISRVFDRRFFHFEGRIHEQLVTDCPEKAYSFIAPVEINHLGYYQNEDEKHKKADRNIKILLQELKQNPKDPYLIYQIGKAYMYDDRNEEALSYFEKTFEMELDPRLDWVESLIVDTGNLYVKTGQKEKGLLLESLKDDFKDSADYHFMMGYVFMQNAQFDKAIDYYESATTMKEGKMRGSNSFNSFYNIGVIYECMGKFDKAREYYRKCGDFNKALDGIKRIK